MYFFKICYSYLKNMLNNKEKFDETGKKFYNIFVCTDRRKIFSEKERV